MTTPSDLPQAPEGETPVMGPDMGQPHFSQTYPGTPYQGAPIGAVPTAGQAAQTMVPPQQPQQPVMGQPVYGQPQQPMYYQPVMGQPVYGQPLQQPMQQPVFIQPQPPQQFVTAPQQPTPPSTANMEEVMQAVKDAAEGKADPSSLLQIFSSVNDDFWKGAVVGAGLALLGTSEPVRAMFTGLLGTLLGKGAEDAERDEVLEDMKAEEAAKAAAENMSVDAE